MFRITRELHFCYGHRLLNYDGKCRHLHGHNGKAVIERIKSLAIPPAWTEVWICPRPDGHLQATGRDARGRKQYIYHERWREVRDETKFGTLLEFGQALPALRKRVD